MYPIGLRLLSWIAEISATGTTIPKSSAWMTMVV